MSKKQQYEIIITFLKNNEYAGEKKLNSIDDIESCLEGREEYRIEMKPKVKVLKNSI